jgi:hypothetical protein
MDPARVLADDGVEAKSLTHALPYWAITNGAMLLSDGSYEVGFACQPLHLDTLSDDELAAVARRLKRLIETLPAHERARFVYAKDAGVDAVIDAHEALTTGGTGPAAALARRRVAALRAAARSGALLGRRLLVSVTYHPRRTRMPRRAPAAALLGGAVALVAGLALGWIAGLIVGGGAGWFLHWLMGGRPRRPFTPLTRAELEKDRDELDGLRAAVAGALQAAGIQVRPLTDGEYAAWAWRYFNPGRAAAGLAPPTVGHQTRIELPPELLQPRRDWPGGGEWMADVSLRQVIARSDIVRDPDALYVDGHYVKVVAIDTLPVGESVMNGLVGLLASATPFTVVVDVAREPRGAALARLALRSRLLRGIVQEQGAPDAVAAERGLQTTHQVQYEATGGEIEIVRLGVSVVVASPTLDGAREAARQVVEFFRTEMQDVQAVDEVAALGRQFFALAPFSGRIQHRTRAALSITAVHFLPLAGPPQDASRPALLLRNRYHGLTAIDPFDPRQGAWNAVAAGKTGSGKSFFAAILAMTAHAAGERIIIVDRGSNEPPGPWLSVTRYLGGQEVSVDPALGASINPCDLPPGAADPDPHKVTFLITLVSRMVSAAGDPLDGYERGIVEAAVRAAYARARRQVDTLNGPGTVLAPVFLHDVVQSLRTLGAVAGTHEVTDEDRAAARRTATRLYQWIDRGRFAALVDRPTTVNLESDWVYIDVAALESNPELMPVMILILTDLIWRTVLRDVGQRRTLVVLDEVWALIADPVAGQFVEDLYRRFRTTGSGVVSISQDIRDFQGNPHALAVLANCNTYYLFPTESPAACGEVLRLTPREVDAHLAHLSAASGDHAELLLVQRFQDRSRSGVLVLVPSRDDYWLAASGALERARRQQSVTEHGTLHRALAALVRESPERAGAPLAAAPTNEEVLS